MAAGVGAGDWLAYASTEDGFLTSLHDLAPVAEDGGYRVVFFNPGSNTAQVSKLRLVNNGGDAALPATTPDPVPVAETMRASSDPWP